MFLHRQQQYLLSQLSSCLCNSSLTSHHALASRKQDSALVLKVRQMPNPSPGPMLGELGNVMFRTQMCWYLFLHQKQSRLVFS